MKKYEVIKAQILSWIADGTLLPTEKVPPEDELCRTLDASKTPVRQALRELASEGYIYTLQGSGSYVRRLKPATQLSLYTLLASPEEAFEEQIIQGIRSAIRAQTDRDIRLILDHPGETTEELIGNLGRIDPGVSGGLLVVPVVTGDRTLTRRLGAALARMERPDFGVVVMDQGLAEFRGSMVSSDHETAACELTDHLMEMGHREIAIITDHPDRMSIQLRLRGTRAAFKSRGLSLRRDRVVRVRRDEICDDRSGYVRTLLDSGVTAALCLENELAVEIYRGMEELGGAGPAALSLCSFDNLGFADIDPDYLTHVEQPLRDVGTRSVEVVLQHLERPQEESVEIRLKPKLVFQRSVANLRTDAAR